MDSYLLIAQKVLKEARQPLSAREILKAAYQLQIVPRDLYGRTQHKTLQARLATDILNQRMKSQFFRTGPGRFFLRALQSDDTLPASYRREYIAPLRAAQLGKFDVLTISRPTIRRLSFAERHPLRISDLAPRLSRYHRMDEARRNLDLLVFRIMVVLLHNGKILIHQERPLLHGEIPSRASLGFEGFIKREDKCLFSDDEVGLKDAGLRTISEWLDLAPNLLARLEPIRGANNEIVLYQEGDQPALDDLMVILSFDCSSAPDVVQSARCADIYHWRQLPICVNDPSGFDRWSSRILTDPELQMSVCG